MKLKEECGIFGGFCFSNDIAPLIKKGLFYLQHRGQESAGISSGEYGFNLYKASGLVEHALTSDKMMNLTGRFGIGHVRYSTQGFSDELHAQPFLINYLNENVAVAHNGNVSCAIQMRQKFEKMGEVFLTNSDTETMLKRVVFGMKKSPSAWTFDEVAQILKKNFIEGSWSILFQLPSRVLAYRDPFGYRPLMLCIADEGYFVASEDCAFSMLNVQKIIEIQPGYGVEITENNYKIKQYSECEQEQKCVFEHIYFAKPVSNIFGKNVYLSRIDMGKKLAQESFVEADIVVPVMDSGLPAALGYAHESKIPLQMGLVRNHFVGRSFISPSQCSRVHCIREKIAPNASVLKDKRVVIVDDSIVRGTTSRELVQMVKNAGAKEVHFRVASPMVVNTCSWGVDISSLEELISNFSSSEKDIAEFLGADSLKYLSFNGLQQIFDDSTWCYKCFVKAKKGNECIATKELVLT